MTTILPMQNAPKLNIQITRDELAALFRVSTKTIARWEHAHRLPCERKNSRVIRYRIEAVLYLAAKGMEFDRTECERLGFRPEEILSRATALRHGESSASPMPHALPASTSEADFRVIELLRHPIYGDYVRKFAIAIQPI